MFQYRIIVNTVEGQILENIPDCWSFICGIMEQRGQNARLERRLVTDKSILPLLTDTKGWVVLRDTVVSPWEILAEAEFGRETT